MTTMTDALLPCPFCGGDAKTDQWNDYGKIIAQICCGNTRCPIGPITDELPLAEAVAAWNTRADRQAAILEGMEIMREAAAHAAMAYRDWVNWTGDTFPDEPGTTILSLDPAAILSEHARRKARSTIGDSDGDDGA